jgi:tetratricopeptide (TPR) repeat protein
VIYRGRYTSGRIAVANLSASIESLELRCFDSASFENLVALSELLFLRGDVLGRIADHDCGEQVANAAIASSPSRADALYIHARLAERFHRFREAATLVDQAFEAGYPIQEIDTARAAALQATGKYREALVLREKLARDHPGIDTLGALASLLAESDRWSDAQDCYAAALEADNGVSPFPASQLLFEWGVNQMRRRDLCSAESTLAELAAILPAHVPGRGHRAEVALARGQSDFALSLIAPLVEISDDPEYRATYAEILAARGDPRSMTEVKHATAGYERLLARRFEAYADHAATFFIGAGNWPQLAVDLATANWKLRDTPRSRKLLAKARRKAEQVLPLASDDLAPNAVDAGKHA